MPAPWLSVTGTPVLVPRQECTPESPDEPRRHSRTDPGIAHRTPDRTGPRQHVADQDGTTVDLGWRGRPRRPRCRRNAPEPVVALGELPQRALQLEDAVDGLAQAGNLRQVGMHLPGGLQPVSSLRIALEADEHVRTLDPGVHPPGIDLDHGVGLNRRGRLVSIRVTRTASTTTDGAGRALHRRRSRRRARHVPAPASLRAGDRVRRRRRRKTAQSANSLGKWRARQDSNLRPSA